MKINNCGITGIDDLMPIDEKFTDFISGLTTPENVIPRFLNEVLAPYLGANFNRILQPDELKLISSSLKEQVDSIQDFYEDWDVSPETIGVIKQTIDTYKEQLVKHIEDVNPTNTISDKSDTGNYLNNLLFKPLKAETDNTPSNSTGNVDTPINDSPMGEISSSLGFVPDHLINLDSKISNRSDLDNLYAGALNAQLWLEKSTRYNILHNFLIDHSNDTYNITSQGIDTTH